MTTSNRDEIDPHRAAEILTSYGWFCINGEESVLYDKTRIALLSALRRLQCSDFLLDMVSQWASGEMTLADEQRIRKGIES